MTPAVARAYVNHGRWIIECQCGNAVEAVREPLWTHQAKIGQKKWKCAPPEGFGAGGFCGSAYSVLWPDVERTEAILTLRPDPRNRNWWPGESFKQLVGENLEHGCNVPEGEAA